MKSYTDLEQSKKLAEFLPLESADMYYHNRVDIPDNFPLPIEWKHNNPLLSQEIPCWSLAALLDYLCEIDFFPEIEADEHGVTMSINYYDEEEARLLAPVHNIKVKAESFIDACVAIIIKLSELKML